MDEFQFIDTFLKSQALSRSDVIQGIGDDGAWVRIPKGQDLIITTDTLVENVHFLTSWDPYGIAAKAVIVNISDLAAMGATPCWLNLALTLPELNQTWLHRFSNGLAQTLKKYHIALIGGDTTRGPLNMTLTMHGFVPKGKAICRATAQIGDRIYLSGTLGSAALAVSFLNNPSLPKKDKEKLMSKLLYPIPRLDFQNLLHKYASAAIDISDGLSADLGHICVQSGVGACLIESAIPIHSLVIKYQPQNALHLALTGGDEYELCFTVPVKKEKKFLRALAACGLFCYPIGVIEAKEGLRLKQVGGELIELQPQGYVHFQ